MFTRKEWCRFVLRLDGLFSSPVGQPESDVFRSSPRRRVFIRIAFVFFFAATSSLRFWRTIMEFPGRSTAVGGTQGRGLYIIYEKYVRRVDLSRDACCARPVRLSGGFCICIFFFTLPKSSFCGRVTFRRQSVWGPAAVYPNQTSPCSLSSSSSRVRLLFIQFFVYYFNANVSTCVWFTWKKKITTAPNKSDRMEIVWPPPSHWRGEKNEKHKKTQPCRASLTWWKWRLFDFVTRNVVM